MIWMIEKLRTRLYLKESHYDLDAPIQIEVEYQLVGDKVFSSSQAKKVRYNRSLLIKEARSRSAAELDRMVNEEVQRVIEGYFFSRGYGFRK